MADGGWTYYTHTWYHHDVVSFAREQDSFVSFQTSLEAMAGWSRHTDIYAYNLRGWWFSIEHDVTGARVVFAYNGYIGTDTSTFIHADNDYAGTTRVAQNWNATRWLCYIPASFNATALGTHPGLSNFLPANCTKFLPLDGYWDRNPQATGEPRHQTHWMERNGGLIIAHVDKSEENYAMDRLNIMGECLIPIHAADSGSNAAVAHLSIEGVNYSDPLLSQLYDADGTFRTGWSWYVPSTFIQQGICDGPPWTWYSPLIYRSSTNLDTGVVPGSGIKGLVNSEWLRITNATYGPTNYFFQMNDGDFVYVRGGLAIGFDTSNGGII